MNKIIVIGGNHHNTLGLIRSVGEKGLPVYVFLVDSGDLSTCNLRFSKYIKQLYQLNDDTEILKLLRTDFWYEDNNPIILCASDSSVCLLDAHYDELKEKFHFFNAGEQGRISYFMNKTNMFSIADECGLQTIKTWHINQGEHVPNDIVYPCFCKANNSAIDGKNGLGVCYDESELKNRLNIGSSFLVQEYIEKDYEIDIVGFSYNHGEDVLIDGICRKIRDYTDRQSQYDVLEDISKYPNVNYEAIKRLVRKIGYEGIFSVEFICHNGVYYFLEINLRNDGTGWLYTSSGANYPYMWYLYCKNQNIPKIKIKKPLYIMQMSDFSDVIHNKITLLHWLKDFSRTRAFFVLNLHDPKPFMFMMWYFLKLALRKLHILR